MKIFFDYETGGVKDELSIQLACAVYDRKWACVEAHEWKIIFDEQLCQPEALKLNHYDRDKWRDEAKPLVQVMREFGEVMERHKTVRMVSKAGRPYVVARLAGHNAATFDHPRLQRDWGKDFLPASFQVLDTLQLALWYFEHREDRPENLRLETLVKWFGIEVPGAAHDALYDVHASAMIARAMTCGT